MGNASTHRYVLVKMYTQYDFLDIKHDFSVFGCDDTNDFVVMHLSVLLAKK